MYAALTHLWPDSLEEMILLPNPAYNPDFVVGPWSGRPLWGPGVSDPVFEAQLTKAIRKAGRINNPVCVVDVKGHLYVTYGATRVRAAKALGMQVPAIVSGPYAQPPAWMKARRLNLQNPEEFLGCFREPPAHWRVMPEGYLEFWGCVPRSQREPAQPAATHLKDVTSATSLPA